MLGDWGGAVAGAGDDGGFVEFCCGGGELFVPAGGAPGRAVYAVAPQDVLLSAAPLPRVSARNVLEGVVEAIDLLDENAIVRVRARGALWRSMVTVAAVRELELAGGKPVWLAVKTQAFRRLR